MKQFLPFIRDVLLILILVVGILLLDRNDKMVDKILEHATKASAQNTSEQTAETAETADINTNTTSETAAADYNYIYFRHSNQWVTNKLICYEVVDNGQNIKFSAENSAGDTLSYYTNMANVVLMYKNEN